MRWWKLLWNQLWLCGFGCLVMTLGHQVHQFIEWMERQGGVWNFVPSIVIIIGSGWFLGYLFIIIYGDVWRRRNRAEENSPKSAENRTSN
jgi:hypothetical protein